MSMPQLTADTLRHLADVMEELGLDSVCSIDVAVDPERGTSVKAFVSPVSEFRRVFADQPCRCRCRFHSGRAMYYVDYGDFTFTAVEFVEREPEADSAVAHAEPETAAASS